MNKKSYGEAIVSVSGTRLPGGEYVYNTTRKDGGVTGVLNSRRRYKWFHQWLTPDASGVNRVIHYFSTKARVAPVPAWVPGRAERLETISIVYL
jgi:hypothetical protein